MSVRNKTTGVSVARSNTKRFAFENVTEDETKRLPGVKDWFYCSFTRAERFADCGPVACRHKGGVVPAKLLL